MGKRAPENRDPKPEIVPDALAQDLLDQASSGIVTINGWISGESAGHRTIFLTPDSSAYIRVKTDDIVSHSHIENAADGQPPTKVGIAWSANIQVVRVSTQTVPADYLRGSITASSQSGQACGCVQPVAPSSTCPCCGGSIGGPQTGFACPQTGFGCPPWWGIGFGRPETGFGCPVPSMVGTAPTTAMGCPMTGFGCPGGV